MDVLKDKSQILGGDDFEYEEVEVKSWGVRVLIRSLTVEEAEWVPDMAKDATPEDVSQTTFRILTRAVVHPGTKQPIFDEDDIPKLMSRSRKPALALLNRILALSRIGEEEIAAAGKDSAPPQGAASNSSSAAPSESSPQPS